MERGLARTGIGIVVGIIVGLGFFTYVPKAKFFVSNLETFFFLGLLPVRVLEWSFFLWLPYRRFALTRAAKVGAVSGGIVLSFLLDAIGVVAAFCLPGGVWIC